MSTLLEINKCTELHYAKRDPYVRPLLDEMSKKIETSLGDRAELTKEPEGDPKEVYKTFIFNTLQAKDLDSKESEEKEYAKYREEINRLDQFGLDGFPKPI